MALDFGPGTTLTSGPQGGLGGGASAGGGGASAGGWGSSASSFSGALSLAGIGLNVGSAIASGNPTAIAGTVGGTALGAGAGFLIGGPPGALIGGSLGSSIGGMFGKSGKGGGGPDARAIAAVNAARGELGSLQQSVSSLNTIYGNPLTAEVFARAGLSKDDYNTAFTNAKNEILNRFPSSNEIMGAAGGHGLVESYNATRGSIYSLTPTNFPDIKLVKPLDYNLDYTDPSGQGGKFVFHPETPGAQYTAAQEIGTKAINRQLASRGLYTSEAGIETLSRFNKELAGQEEARQTANQEYTYGTHVAGNLQGQAYDASQFAEALQASGLNQQWATNQANIAAGLQNTAMQVSGQVALGGQQLALENQQFQYTQDQNALNRAQNQIYQGIGSYYQAEQAGRTNKLTDAMTKYYGA